jgi:outer membrane protein assembly factor BamB
LGPTFSSPVVAEDGTVYMASDGASNIAHLFAFEPDGTQKWRFDFTPTNPRSTPAIGPDGTIYIGNDDDELYAINPDGTEKWTYQTGGDVRGEPLVHDEGSIWFGSRDHNLYVVDSAGLLLQTFSLGADISESDPDGSSYPWDNWIYAASPAQGPDGTVYMGADDGDFFAFTPSCQPQNIKSRYYSYDDLPAEYSISDADDWMESGPWAVRVEIERSDIPNARSKYEYTLRAWIRQCQESDCSDILGTYFEDTRIEYAAKAPHLEQTAELCGADDAKLDTFIFGFTQGTGSATQTIDITETQLGFIRPGDFVITEDDDWPDSP